MKKSMRLTLLFVACMSASCFAENSFYQNGYLHLNTALKRLDAVSCDKTATQCVAVGFGGEYHLHERLAYASQDGGLTWSEPTVLASPKEEITPVLSDSPNPANIHCDESGQQCIVTSSAIIERVPTPVVYTTKDGGVTWSTPKTLSLPKGIDRNQIYENDSLFTAISCDQAGTVCTIAGGLAGDNEATPLIYTTKDAGETWKLFSALKQPFYQAPSTFYHGTFLSGVSCNFSGRNCVAVGNSVISTSFFGDRYSSHSVAYSTQDGGEHWSKPIVLPMEETQSNVSTFVDVACDGAGMQCTSIGYIYDFYTAAFQPFSFTTHNGGLDWDGMNLITQKEGKHVLNSIHCDDSGKHCVAVGWETKRITTIPILKPLVFTSNNAGKMWEKYTDMPFPNSSRFNDIFCNNTGEQCIAVGTQVDASFFAAKQLTASLNKHLPFTLHKPQFKA
ncbi:MULTISPECIES: sialidase family protein [Legionella]|uniref:BNR/Asp-box repeat containing protein n=1 Tax=Legionella maceachernii TaxID=466 RepID=A0A0W0W142_9GAMM|nr:sialidase family protein [Legionella maceachernii]KTD26015.1 BNR/Asp-box repeat containing protein [Legionella maceachernii]SJZ50694.1 BNR repeat-like domain-containing protein [Legionella maceachernii]SUP03739.1 Uncharacterized protein related to plant photosystem II stability/assembly factor [Legionella maceachernii]